MFEQIDLFRTAFAMARHAGHRQTIATDNIANSDTPEYRARRLPSFAAMMDQSDASAMRRTSSKHLGGAREEALTGMIDKSLPVDLNGNSVQIEHEVLASVEAERQQNRALAIYQSAQSILKTSIGRGR